MAPHRFMLQQGLVMVPEGRGIFTRLTVRKPAAGRYRGVTNRRYGTISNEYAPPSRLNERLNQPAGLLSGGEQQMVAMGRALLSRPRPVDIGRAVDGAGAGGGGNHFSVVKQLARDGVTLLLSRANARLALESTDRAYVLDSGSLSHTGRSRRHAGR